MKRKKLTPRPTPLAILLLALLTLFLTAHSQPTQITPSPGATLGRSPQEIRLTFAEPVTPNASITVLPQDSFAAIAGVMAQQDPQNPAQIFASLPPLDPGTYTVQWQVESSDGHFVSGFYSFAVASSLWAVIPPWAIVLVIGLSILVGLVIFRRRTTRNQARQQSSD